MSVLILNFEYVPVGMYFLKVDNGNTWTMWETFLNLAKDNRTTSIL